MADNNSIDKMICTLGTQDIPAIQEQPKFKVDLLNTNVLLFGSPMSGKTNLIKLIISILHKRYREKEEQIFILDFGGGLADFEKLPLVSAYFDNANEEYVKRVFKLLEDQLRDNITKLKGKNFKAAKENQPVHTTLFIDNVNAFLDEPRYSSYQEKLAKLCRDGLTKGITIVMTASSTKGLNTMMPTFKQKIALDMPVESYVDIFNHKVIPVGNNPGHGFANVTVMPEDITGTFPLQTAYELQLNVSDDILSDDFCLKIKEHFEERTVKKYKRFPDELNDIAYQDFVENDDYENDVTRVSVGLDYTECQPVVMDFESSKAVAVYGKKGFGKTNLLWLLMNGFINEDKYKFVLFDDGRGQLEKFTEVIVAARLKYIKEYEEATMLVKEKMEQKPQNMKLSPIQLFIKYIHENYVDLTHVKRLSNPVMTEVFGSNTTTVSNVDENTNNNVVFVLQSKYLYVNSAAAKVFMEVILPSMVARADEKNWIFIFTDVKSISDADTRENFHSTIGTAFLLDSIAEFVGERGQKSLFGSMDAKSLKEEFAPCEKGDGYCYSIERDVLKKLKFKKYDLPEDKKNDQESNI